LRHFEFYRCQVEKTGKSTCQVAQKKLKVAVYFSFNCKFSSFCKETVLNGKEETSRVPKNSPELEWLHLEVLELAAAKMNFDT